MLLVLLPIDNGVRCIPVQGHQSTMKPISTRITLAIAFLLSTVGSLGQQSSASANSIESPLTPAQANRLSRDLVPSRSQEFFQQGRDEIDRQIRILQQHKRQNASGRPVLQLNQNSQAELEQLPQLQPQDFWQPPQSQQ
jgi:hypothetical protein